MTPNKLTKEARELLGAIIKDGATVGVLYATTPPKLVALVGWPTGKKSETLLEKTLRSLVTTPYSVQLGQESKMGSMLIRCEFLRRCELANDGRIELVLGVPPEILRYI